MRISETPSPTGSQSPKFPNVALVRRARILAFAFRSARPDSHASKSDDRNNVFKLLHCIRVDTFPQARADAFGRRPFRPPYNTGFFIPAEDPGCSSSGPTHRRSHHVYSYRTRHTGSDKDPH